MVLKCMTTVVKSTIDIALPTDAMGMGGRGLQTVIESA
jgi:hypothetical protein